MNPIPSFISFITPLMVYIIPPKITPLPPQPLPEQYSYTILASWYGPGFEGNSMANGQPFNKEDFTVAHRSYPFGTKLRITYKNNSVVATVTDRGPYKRVKGEYFEEDRDIDLSEGTAKAIGFTGVDVVTISEIK